MKTALENEAVGMISLLRAAEDWSDQYGKDPVSHAKLIKNESKWIVAMINFFKVIAADPNLINWYAYRNQVKADYNVDVIISDNVLTPYSAEFMKVSLEFVVGIVTAGAQSGEAIYDIPLGLDSTDAIIQRLGTDRVARLVGKRVKPDGTIIDNPRPEYNITQTLRKDIAQSITTSLNMGETVQEAQARVDKVIKNPKRSEKIARTESVNAFQAGLTEFGTQSNAVGKVWQTVGATDICATFAELGPVPFDFLYDGVFDGPTAHVGCRCGRRLIYQAEWNNLQK